MPRSANALQSIAFIGGGKMGEAILAGLLAAPKDASLHFEPQNCTVVNPGLERRRLLNSRYGVTCLETASQLGQTDLVFLCVKPQIMQDVLPELAGLPWLAGSLVVSIAAGVSTKCIEEALPTGARVVRAMPNTPLMVGRGATAVCAGSTAHEEDLVFVQELFGQLGSAVCVDESLMDVVTAISGSGPAYFASLIENMAAAGKKLGLSAQLAEELARATAEGTAVLLKETKKGAAQVRKDVCSPGGTTLAALEAMETAGYATSIQSGVQAAYARSKELSK